MKHIIIIAIVGIFVFGIETGFLLDANADERNCKPDLTCFLPNDFLEYSTYENGNLVWKTIYKHNGFYDENKILVQKTDESFDNTIGMLIDGKVVSTSTTEIDSDLRSGVSAQILYGYTYNVIQPSPVNVDKWLKHPTSAESWKDKVTEGNFIFNDKTRSVIFVKTSEFKQIIDKQTGILLLIEYTGPLYDSYLEKLTSTNIIDNNSQNPEKTSTLVQNESIKYNIPDWVRNNAKWWSDGSINDETFVSGMRHLIKEEIIKIPQTTSTGSAKDIPSWIKNNAKWWSEKSIDDESFISSMQYLISNGIIDISENACSGTARCISGIVTEVIDGDTIKVDGQSIRFALSSAPELDEFNGENARNLIVKICPVNSKVLVDEDDKQTQGSYGRIIGLIKCNNVILNEKLVSSGLGVISKNFCNSSEFSVLSWAQNYGCAPKVSSPTVTTPKVTTNPPKDNCDPSYPTVCIPPYPPDLNCKDIPYKKFKVLQPDPHGFDRDRDGIGCES